MFQALLRRREARLFFIISILFFICIHSIDAFGPHDDQPGH